MKIVEFFADGFRNLKEITLHPCDTVNLICGDNAQGKTNLIEAIWLFSGAKSFRKSKESRLVAFDREKADLTLQFEDSQRVQVAQMVLAEKNKATLNRVPLKSCSDFSGNFYCVAFSPAHLSIAQGSPSVRRKFIDIAIAQLKPDYNRYLSQYDRVLTQRNSLLKNLQKRPRMADTLEVWDMQLAKLGTILTILRQDYVSKLAPFAVKVYDGISHGKEQFSLTYQSTAFENAVGNEYNSTLVQHYFEVLRQNCENDFRTGFTTVGVHRDELELTVGGLSVKNYGSQGQQRSCVLALKLAEAQLLQTVTGETPIVLLDDVMSELDAFRQDYLYGQVQGHQVFITCCDPASASRQRSGAVFTLAGGCLLSSI